MLIIKTVKDQKVIFAHRIGVCFDLYAVYSAIQSASKSSELSMMVYGQELDFLYQKNLITNNNHRIVQTKMPVSRILDLVGHFEKSNQTYLVA